VQVNAILAGGMVILLWLALWSRRHDGTGRVPIAVPITVPIAITTGALILTLLQLLPLPQQLIGIIAPGANDVLSMTLGSDLAWWAPMSMDPPATHGELLKLVTYAAAAILGVLLCGGPRLRIALQTAMMTTSLSFSFTR